MLSRKKFIELNAGLTFSGILFNLLPASTFASNPNRRNTQSADPFKGHENRIDFNFFDALKDYRIVQSYDPGNLLIMGYELTDDLIKTIPANRNATIYCYKSSISSPIKLDGANLFILANKLVCNRAAIDVSGKIGQNCNPTQKTAIPGLNGTRNPNDPDLNADNSFVDIQGNPIQGDATPGGPMNGQNGGSVFIGCMDIEGDLSVISIGGKGGTGQQGANGRNGADLTGANGGDRASLLKAPNFNMSGFPAENGGSGALGGFGGNGGNLSVYCSDANMEQTLIAAMVSSGGMQGDSGSGGTAGGAGGKGEQLTIFPTLLPGLINGYERITATTNLGPGQLGPSPINKGDRTGQKGNIIAAGSDAYYKYIPYDFAKLLLLKAESLYLNGTFAIDDPNVNEAYAILNFLLQIASNKPGTGFADRTDGNQAFITQNLFYLQGYANDPLQWAALKQKCTGYIGQISLNLDFFGNPPNYAPTLTADFLVANYVQMLPLIAGFRDFAAKLTQQQTALQLDEFKNNVNIGQCQTNIDQLTKGNIDLANQIVSINLDLQQRFATIENLKTGLEKDNDALNNAITNDGGCGLADIFHCLTAVVSIAAAVYTCGAAAGAAFTAVGSVVKGLSTVDSLAALKNILSDGNSLVRKGITDISKDAGTVEDNIKKISTIYNTQLKDAPEIPDSLIGVDAAKFDAVIDKYTAKYPEAQKYKDDYHAFVDYANSTNQTRIKITSCIMQLNQNYQNIQLLTGQKNDLLTANTMDQAANLSLSNKMSLFDLYYKTRGYAINLIYLQNKALNYQLPDLNLVNNTYDDYSIETLNTDVYKNNWVQVLSLNANNFNSVSNTNPLRVKFSDYRMAYSNFATPLKDRNGLAYFVFEFTILPSNTDLQPAFQSNKRNIKIMGIQAVLNTNQDYNKLITFRITHSGNSVVTLDADFKNERSFIHEPRTANLFSSLNTTGQKPLGFGALLADGSNPKNNLVGGNFVNKDNITLGVSPFATWKLVIYPSDNINLSNEDVCKIIKDLDSIDMYFWYYFQLV